MIKSRRPVIWFSKSIKLKIKIIPKIVKKGSSL